MWSPQFNSSINGFYPITWSNLKIEFERKKKISSCTDLPKVCTVHRKMQLHPLSTSPYELWEFIQPMSSFCFEAIKFEVINKMFLVKKKKESLQLYLVFKVFNKYENKWENGSECCFNSPFLFIRFFYSKITMLCVRNVLSKSDIWVSCCCKDTFPSLFFLFFLFFYKIYNFWC